MSDPHPEGLNIVEFRIGAKHTVNLGNFNNIVVESGLTIAVNAGADFADLRVKAQDVLRGLLEETYKRQRRAEPQSNNQKQGNNH